MAMLDGCQRATTALVFTLQRFIGERVITMSLLQTFRDGPRRRIRLADVAFVIICVMTSVAGLIALIGLAMTAPWWITVCAVIFAVCVTIVAMDRRAVGKPAEHTK